VSKVYVVTGNGNIEGVFGTLNGALESLSHINMQEEFDGMWIDESGYYSIERVNFYE